jgi:hypothetical protein
MSNPEDEGSMDLRNIGINTTTHGVTTQKTSTRLKPETVYYLS